ncbi:MAG: phytoene/squalene synthase family protein [Verrucomicrobiota bacterium]
MSQRDSAADLFRKKSRTFSLAARLFSRDDQDAVARLYRFCRLLDDLADDTAQGETTELDQVIAELDEGARPSHPIAIDFLHLADERSLSIEAAQFLAKALREDCGARRIETESELIHFAFGVAGTVGLLMCPVLGVQNTRALPFAVDLGIALQLTNIARDVVEDADRNRYYLPKEWITPGRITHSIKNPGTDSKAVDHALARLLEVAEHFYQSAFLGHWFIPPRNRRAVFLATSLYREIGRSLLRLGHGSWRTRRSLSSKEKTVASFAALKRYLKMKRKGWSSKDPPQHDKDLAKKLSLAGVQIENFTPR